MLCVSVFDASLIEFAPLLLTVFDIVQTANSCCELIILF